MVTKTGARTVTRTGVRTVDPIGVHTGTKIEDRIEGPMEIKTEARTVVVKGAQGNADPEWGRECSHKEDRVVDTETGAGEINRNIREVDSKGDRKRNLRRKNRSSRSSTKRTRILMLPSV